jgi:hypothetical protein
MLAQMRYLLAGKQCIRSQQELCNKKKHLRLPQCHLAVQLLVRRGKSQGRAVHWAHGV